MANDTKTVLLVGVGGQGTILAGDILARVAVAAGKDVKLSEIHGMSQRGGSVNTVVRFGTKVHSMIADLGCADYIVAFEKIEALRNQEYLNKESGIMLVNNEIITPISVSSGAARMPKDPDGRLEKYNAIKIDATKIAESAGSPKSSNVVLLGALSCVLDFDTKLWEDEIAKRVPQKTIDANLKAFSLGRKAFEEQNAFEEQDAFKE